MTRRHAGTQARSPARARGTRGLILDALLFLLCVLCVLQGNGVERSGDAACARGCDSGDAEAARTQCNGLLDARRGAFQVRIQRLTNWRCLVTRVALQARVLMRKTQ